MAFNVHLYHFTTERDACLIRQTGNQPQALAVPGGKHSKQDVVSLTINPEPNRMVGKSLGNGQPMKGRLLRAWRAEEPLIRANLTPLLKNTCEARIHYSIPVADVLLIRFTKDAAKRLGFNETALLDFLEEGGGKIGEWWVYTGTLPSCYVAEIRVAYPDYNRVI